MKKREIVKDNRYFNLIINSGLSIKNHEFVIYYLHKDIKEPKFGIAVGTKIGKAVERNHYKRQIRHIIDKNKNLFSNYYDYIIIMKKACTLLKYNETEKSLVSLIEKKVGK